MLNKGKTPVNAIHLPLVLEDDKLERGKNHRTVMPNVDPAGFAWPVAN